MILLIDWGNTRLKYTFINSEVDSLGAFVENEYVFNVDSTNTLDEFIKQLEMRELSQKTFQNLAVQKALIASVKSKDDNLKLQESLNEKGIESIFAKTTNEACGVTCGYDDPELLGVDRWLAVLAAYQRNITIGIIDIGSAITLDLVDGVGLHLGGHIVPGVKLLKESLSNTAKVKVLPNELSVNIHSQESGTAALIKPILGHSTTECVNVGIESLIMGYLVQSILKANESFNVKRWIITGGDGSIWLEKLNKHNKGNKIQELTLSYDLVFQGLIKLFAEKLKNHQ
jgi:type III pantothenate kinase